MTKIFGIYTTRSETHNFTRGEIYTKVILPPLIFVIFIATVMERDDPISTLDVTNSVRFLFLKQYQNIIMKNNVSDFHANVTLSVCDHFIVVVNARYFVLRSLEECQKKGHN